MKNLTKMGIECDYSFEMLYRAAFGKNIPVALKKKLQQLSQNEINKLVIKWTGIAGWKTIERSGSDNITYLAFYP